MIKVMWINFSGSSTSSYKFQSLYSSGMSLYIGNLKDSNIGPSIATCSCGACVSCKANIENIIEYEVEIENITLDKQYVGFSKFSKEFYTTFKKLVKEKFPDFFEYDINLALVCEEEPNISEIIKEFLARLTKKGYGFTTSEFSIKNKSRLPLSLTQDEQVKFSNWVKERISVNSSFQSNDDEQQLNLEQESMEGKQQRFCITL